jgi:Flp pilus assembly protein TadB
MDSEKFHDLIIHELRCVREKLDDQHKRIDNIAQELVRIDTERKTRGKTLDSVESGRQWSWEKILGIIGAIGIAAGLIVGFI